MRSYVDNSSVKLVFEAGFREIYVKGDCLLVVKELESSDECFANFGCLLGDTPVFNYYALSVSN